MKQKFNKEKMSIVKSLVISNVDVKDYLMKMIMITKYDSEDYEISEVFGDTCTLILTYELAGKTYTFKEERYEIPSGSFGNWCDNEWWTESWAKEHNIDVDKLYDIDYWECSDEEKAIYEQVTKDYEEYANECWWEAFDDYEDFDDELKELIVRDIIDDYDEKMCA